MHVWIELPDDSGWGPTRTRIADLEHDGYHATEIAGVRHLLLITGSTMTHDELTAMLTHIRYR